MLGRTLFSYLHPHEMHFLTIIVHTSLCLLAWAHLKQSCPMLWWIALQVCDQGKQAYAKIKIFH